MAGGDGRHWQDGDEIGDAPVVWHKRCHGKDNHAGSGDESEEYGEFELETPTVSKKKNNKELGQPGPRSESKFGMSPLLPRERTEPSPSKECR